ncbi:MAG TPA: DUF4386 domain-containing protein [Longimicrobium sp.]|nr:DUF4386 domain-containing protein [Longimicrobium sp.]
MGTVVIADPPAGLGVEDGADRQEARAGAAPRSIARIGGVLYLVIIAGGLFGEAYIRNRVIVPGDAAATAANLQSMEPLWRFGIASEFFMLACTTVLALILYVLLRPVNRDLALLAVFFNLVSIAVEAVNEQQLLAAMFPLGNAGYLAALQPEQLYALASLSLTSYSHGFGISLIFFGCECIVLGYLIFKSGYLPRTVGVLMQVAGACYLVNSFALIVDPGFASRIFPAILVPAFVGELSFCLWLLVRGVNVEEWRSRPGARPIRPARATVPA